MTTTLTITQLNYKNGKPHIMWFNDPDYGDQYHNTGGPAIVQYFESGNVKCMEYYVNGQVHCTSGPAFIEYDENGNITSQRWYLHGHEMDRTLFPASMELLTAAKLLYG